MALSKLVYLELRVSEFAVIAAADLATQVPRYFLQSGERRSSTTR